MQSSRLKTQESKVLAEMTDDGKIIETVVRAHYDTCDYTRNKMEPFLAKARASPSYAVCTGTVSSALFLCHERVSNLPIRMHDFAVFEDTRLIFKVRHLLTIREFVSAQCRIRWYLTCFLPQS